tara:strand:+ start:2088 stop:3263 length:1176 start_codon:yes stop_codon:yes gene_type:complete
MFIKKRGLSKFLVITLLLFVLLSSFALAKTVSVSPNIEKDCLYYFYGDDCPNCKNIETYLYTLQQKHPNITIEKFEVYYNQQNNELLNQYFKVFGVEKDSQGIPIIFIGGSYLIGEQSITTLLEGSIKNNPSSACPSLQEVQTIGVVGMSSSPEVLKTLSFLKVTGEALRNMFGPGMLALLLILIVILTVTTEKENVLKRGILFVTGIYIAHLIFGIGRLDIFYDQTLGKMFSRLVGLSMVVYALIKIKAFFGTWEVILKNFPKDLKELLKKYVRHILSPIGMLLTGFVLSMFTFFSSDKTMILIRNLFEGQYKRTMVLPILLYHNLILILLLVVVIISVYFLRERLEDLAHKKGKDNEEKKKKFSQFHAKMLDFFTNILLLILGVVLLFI